MDETIDEEIDTAPLLNTITIFDRKTHVEAVPQGFSAATILLDAKPEHSLDWKEASLACDNLIAHGYKICFELDLGLVGSSNKRVGIQTLVLAIDEFRENLLPKYREHTVGCILYRTSEPIFSSQFLEYLEQLRQDLPDSLACLLLVDCSTMRDPYSFAREFALDRFNGFTLAIKQAPAILSCCTWNEGQGRLGYIGRDLSRFKQKECSTAILMPGYSQDAEELKPLFENLALHNVPYKVIAEDHLPLEWEGLDELYIVKNTLAPTTLRTLEGFKAAGGTIKT